MPDRCRFRAPDPRSKSWRYGRSRPVLRRRRRSHVMASSTGSRRIAANSRMSDAVVGLWFTPLWPTASAKVDVVTEHHGTARLEAAGPPHAPCCLGSPSRSHVPIASAAATL
jgi:hypothetical protein